MRFALLLLALLAAVSASAQPTPRSLVVEGTAEVEAPPDVVTVTFSVETSGRDAQETFREHEREVARVLQAVRQFGIPDRDIDLERVGYSRSDRETQAVRLIRVETDSLRIVPDLVAAIVGAGADRIQDVSYGLSDPSRYDDQALEAAAARAREKAARLAGAFGARVGPVRAVLESGIQPPTLERTVARGGRVAYSVDGVQVTGGGYATGAETVSARIVVEYDLIVDG